jgi:ribonuclease HI
MIDIWFDGGSLNNQSASRKGYGSFKTFYRGKEVEMTIDRGTKDEKKTTQARIDWDSATNNEAEWKTLIVAVCYAIQVQNGSNNPLKFAFHGDSQNVIGAFVDGNKTKAANLKPLREEAENYLEILHDAGAEIEFVKEPDTAVKKILGH